MSGSSWKESLLLLTEFVISLFCIFIDACGNLLRQLSVGIEVAAEMLLFVGWILWALAFDRQVLKEMP